MVAGGSSGGRNRFSGGHGGGLYGGTSISSPAWISNPGGTQTTGFALGAGENGRDFLTGDGTPGSGGGGGYYGGFAINRLEPGGGGSGFISGHPGCDAVDADGNHTGQPIHFSGLYFSDTIMETGVAPLDSDGMETGAAPTGHGRVVITPLDGTVIPPVEARLRVLLDVGEQVQLSMAHLLPVNLDFIWTTTDASVVTVDANGVVTGTGLGKAYIWAESLCGEYRDYIPFKVVEDAEAYRLALHLTVGETRRLWLGDDPLAVDWLSMDTSVVTVDVQGRVTGVGHGLAIVRGN